MMAVAEGMFIMGMFVVLLHLFYQTARDKKRKRPVDGGLGNLHVFVLHPEQQPFRIEMAVKRKDLMKDPLSFLRELEAFLVEKVPENLLLHDTILTRRAPIPQRIRV